MSSAATLVGTQVGDYEVRKIIGKGGMGTVYEGLHALIHKRVALKVLHRHLSQDTEMTGRFLAEARAVNAIGHRGIIDIFGFGQLPRGEHYFVMELLEGRSLDQVVAQAGPCTVAEVLAWGDEVLDALAAAHDAGVVHRDIKPSNLFLVEPSRGASYMKVLDFGIAKMLSHGPQSPVHTRVGLVGTPSHISPEQVTGAEITSATDLYSLGCVFFELLTGSPPFQSEVALAVMRMHAHDEPPRLSERVSGIPPELDELVATMLRKKPEDRPPSAEAVRAALARIVPTPASTGSPGGHHRRSLEGNEDSGPRRPADQQRPTDVSLAPLTATRPSRPPQAVTRAAAVTPPEVPAAAAAVDQEVTAPSSRAAPTVLARPRPAHSSRSATAWLRVGLGGAALLVLLGLASVWLSSRSQPEPAVLRPATNVAVGPSPEAAPATGPQPSKAQPPEQPADVIATEADSPTAVPEVKTTARPAKAPVTVGSLAARLAAFEKRLAAHEKSLGDRDELLRGQLARARDDARAAKTPRDLAAAEKLVTSLEHQLR